MNQLVAVGKLKEIKDRDGETIITLICSRPFKNEEGEYEYDYIDFVLWGSVADKTKEYCKQGDVIGVKGKIQTEEIDDTKVTKLVAEKITFLSSNPDLKKEDE